MRVAALRYGRLTGVTVILTLPSMVAGTVWPWMIIVIVADVACSIALVGIRESSLTVTVPVPDPVSESSRISPPTAVTMGLLMVCDGAVLVVVTFRAMLGPSIAVTS